ncbi:MAG: ABC transporter substrate-binding protein [Hylemonella sp.]|nr:ABC transporter substrate-binding protein [Hylemonella sp.]
MRSIHMQRRYMVGRAGQALALGLAASVWPGLLRAQAPAASLRRVTVMVPGPGNLLYLPLALAPRIGADAAQGLHLDLRFTSGGPVAMREMLERNADFAAAGLSAAALQRISGRPVVCMAPLTRVPAYTLLVRPALRTAVRTVADLRGRVVGVKGYSPGGRSTSQLFTEYVLERAGVSAAQVNYVSVGQDYQSQQASLSSGAVDAIMGDEPFAMRLVAERQAFALADYHDLQQTRKQLGGLFLNGCLTTREDVIAEQAEVVDMVARTLVRTLVWMAQRPAAEVVRALAIPDAVERDTLAAVLTRHKGIFSPDGRFSEEQLNTAERFLHAVEKTPAAQAFKIRAVINDRWVGSAA